MRLSKPCSIQRLKQEKLEVGNFKQTKTYKNESRFVFSITLYVFLKLKTLLSGTHLVLTPESEPGFVRRFL